MEVDLFPHHPASLKSGEQHDNLGIIEGRQGDAMSILRQFFVENRRTEGQKAGRAAIYGISALTVLPGLYLLSKVVKVPSGSVGLALNSGVVEVYGEGSHCLMGGGAASRDFKTYPLTDEIINRNQFWIITVRKDEYGLGTSQGLPVILGPGVHIIDNPFFSLKQKVFQTAPVISHMGLHRILVPQGMRGLALEGDSPVLLQPGLYTRNSPTFEFHRLIAVDQQVVEIKPFTLVTVFTSQVGVLYRKGLVDVIEPGVHVLYTERGEDFRGLLDMTEQVRELQPLNILTNDGLMVRVQGAISFRIVDALKAVSNIGKAATLRNQAPAPHTAAKAGEKNMSQAKEQPGQRSAEIAKNAAGLLGKVPIVGKSTGGLLSKILAPKQDEAKKEETAGRKTAADITGDEDASESDLNEEEMQELRDRRKLDAKERAETAQRAAAAAEKEPPPSLEPYNMQSVLFATILMRANSTLASLLNGTDLLNTTGLGFATATMAIEEAQEGGRGKGKYERASPSASKNMHTAITMKFMDTLARHLRDEWGVELTDMAVTDLAVMDDDVRKALASGVRASIESNNARRNAETAAETSKISAQASADAAKLASDANAYGIVQTALAQRDGGKLLEASPTAVTIRLAEAGAAAITDSTLMVVPDVSTQSLLTVLGVTKKTLDGQQRSAPNTLPTANIPDLPASQ